MPRADLLATGKMIRYQPVLSPWMMAYAEFLATSPYPPGYSERRAKLGELSNRAIAKTHLAALEGRPDFQKYRDQVARGPLEQARAKYLSRLPKYADAYDQAIDGLVEAKEWKEVASAIAPAVDRIWPKRTDAETAVQVNVTLSPERLAGFTDYQGIEVEAVKALPAE